MGHLDASGLGYRLSDGRQLLEEVSFRVGSGDVVALVGENGAGKTTLLRMLSGELPSLSGGVSVQATRTFTFNASNEVTRSRPRTRHDRFPRVRRSYGWERAMPACSCRGLSQPASGSSSGTP